MFHIKIAPDKPALRTIALPLACTLAALAVYAALTTPGFIPWFYFFHQDSFVLAALIALLLVYSLPREDRRDLRVPCVPPTTRNVLIGAGLLALLLWGATYLLFDNYPLSRDEHMVAFDMQVFRDWRLAAPLAPEWRPFATALVPAFLLPLQGNAALVSAYMPVNAMLRTLFGEFADPALMNPLLVAAGAFATFDCARRLFPGSLGAQSIALLMYATSAQVLVTAMTPYAMTGHLALNMIWLSLYVRGTPKAHAAAIGTGFLAIGLHQIVFHPLFALPFINHLRRQGQLRTALVYLGCYAVFGLFWISYPHLVASSAGVTSHIGSVESTSDFIHERVLPLLANRDPKTLSLMTANLVRFVSWENLALMPLMMFAYGAVRRNEGLAQALAASLLLTLAAMAFLLPYQGLGWGYRYLHGVIGNCCLLAAYGWREASDKPDVRAFVRGATLATVLGSLPFLVWQATAFVRPYARVNRMIDGINADMVVLQTEGPVFRIDEVRNRPDLANRPIRLAGNMLSPADIFRLCARGSVAFVDAAQMQALGLGYNIAPDPANFEALRHSADQCKPKR